jgi:hypothetical protein
MKFAPIPDQQVNRPLTARQLGAQSASEASKSGFLASAVADVREFFVCGMCAAAGALGMLLALSWWQS